MPDENKQRLKEYQTELLQNKKINIKNYLFFLHGTKMKQKALIFDKQCINKNAIHKNKRPVGIDKLKIRRIYLKKIN